MGQFSTIVAQQKQFFLEGNTRSLQFRLGALATLEGGINRYTQELYDALQMDFQKGAFETLATEVTSTKKELHSMMKHLSGYMRPKRVISSFTTFAASGKIYPDPYGTAAIFSPWNYPFFLTMAPLIGAIAGGNTAVVNPSPQTPHTSEVIRQIIHSCFEPEYVAVVVDQTYLTEALLEEPFDFIFFTGSPEIGKVVMKKAAEQLIPVTLELGGKCPCIVDATADIATAARRIVWGKLINAGQTCIAPDYILVEEAVKSNLIQAIITEIDNFYGSNPLDNPDLTGIISPRALQRLKSMTEGQTVLFGGRIDEQNCRMEPTLLDNPSADSLVMQEEIFGPILPIIGVADLVEAIEFVQKRPQPLAAYLFSNKKGIEDILVNNLRFGGGCINSCIEHMISGMPFGGVGLSGMGQYLGKASFDTFTRPKSVLKKRGSFDLKVKYPPFTAQKFSLIKRLLK